MIERGKPGGGAGRVLTEPATVRLMRDAENPWYEVVLTEGRNRQIRKLFEEIGHHVEKIRRVGYGTAGAGRAAGRGARAGATRSGSAGACRTAAQEGSGAAAGSAQGGGAAFACSAACTKTDTKRGGPKRVSR